MIENGEKEGVIKRNAKNDKQFCQEIDNLIYSFSPSEESERRRKRQIENAMFMPMVNSKGQIVGLIQVANSEKLLHFTEADLEVVRLVAFKIANFIT